MRSLHQIFKYTFLLLGAAFTVNAVVATVLTNMHIGIIMTYILGVLFIICGIFFRKVNENLKWTIICISLVAVLVLTSFISFLYTYGNTDTVTYTEDAIIVFGAGIRGEALSENLTNRLNAAVTYHEKNPNAFIVVSGGQGPEEDITEALAMEKYLVGQGIPQNKILKEEQATSTAENFQYSKELLEDVFEENLSVAFITNDYHVYRAQNIGKTVGFESLTYCHNATPWYLIVPSTLREILAVLKLRILG